MIPRYTRPEMAAIWDPQTRYRIWFEIVRGATTSQGQMYPCPLRRRCRDGVRGCARRKAGPWRVGQAACTGWADASSGQDALRRFPQHRIKWDDPSGDEWDHVHLPRLHPHLG